MPAIPFRPTRTAALLLATFLAAPVARAQGEQPPPREAELSAANEAGLELGADLRSSYLAGQQIVVTIRVENQGRADLSFPDLEERPYLVHFELVKPDGSKQTRHSTPPSEDEDVRWQLAPRAARQATLELPSGAALGPGRYQLAVVVRDGVAEHRVGPVDVLLEHPAPVASDLTHGAVAAQSLEWTTPWVHRASAEGAQLYLHAVPASSPARRGYHWHLTALGVSARPWLSNARPSEAGSRHLYWRDDEGSIGYARLEGHRLRRAPRQVGLPWPSWDLLARGASDAQANLLIPVWIPSPKGSSGEVRVVVVDTRGTPGFHRVVLLDERPKASTWVDAAGQLRLLLLHQGKLDLYTLGSGAIEGLPAEGKRLLPRRVGPRVGDAGDAPAADIPTRGLVGGIVDGFVAARLDRYEVPPLLGARFAALPDRENQSGGTAILAWAGGAEDPQAPISGIWLSTGGRIIDTVPGVSVPQGHELRDVLARGYQPMVLVTEDSRGVTWAHSAAWTEAVELGRLGEHAGLRLAPDGALWLQQALESRGVVASRVEPSGE